MNEEVQIDAISVESGCQWVTEPGIDQGENVMIPKFINDFLCSLLINQSTNAET